MDSKVRIQGNFFGFSLVEFFRESFSEIMLTTPFKQIVFVKIKGREKETEWCGSFLGF